MAEHYPDTVKVIGSNPLIATKQFRSSMVRCTELLIRGLKVRVLPELQFV